MIVKLSNSHVFVDELPTYWYYSTIPFGFSLHNNEKKETITVLIGKEEINKKIEILVITSKIGHKIYYNQIVETSKLQTVLQRILSDLI